MEKILWNKFGHKGILNYDQFLILCKQIELCNKINGATAEIGVYEGFTSRLIFHLLQKSHYCYDTFDGKIGRAHV